MAMDDVDVGQIAEDGLKAAGEVLGHGVQSYTRGTRSQTHLNPKDALEAVAMARAMNAHEQGHASTVVDMSGL